jgi:pimeloyl-ACP methyl ester carboxylesterase
LEFFRGYGESDKAMIQIFTEQNLADDVINLIDHLKLENIGLINSMGTVILIY